MIMRNWWSSCAKQTRKEIDMDFLNQTVQEKVKELVAACGDAETNEMQRPFASAYEVWARLKDLREQAKREEKNVDKLHGEIWDAVVEKNDDEQSIELRELGRIAGMLTLMWATIAAEAQRGANEG